MANQQTQELLVPTGSVMTVTRVANSKGFELQNLGPNTIWAALGDPANCVATKCRKIAAGAVWSCGASAHTGLFLTADTATQLSGAATILTEVLG